MGYRNLFKIGFVSFVFLSALVLNSCKSGGYSFTGAKIVGETISIDFFSNKADLVQPTLSQVLTEEIRDKFVRQTSLDLVESGGDHHLEGEIVKYSITPQAIQNNETAALNRLLITVNVRYTNKIEEKDSFESSFTGFEDYDSSQSLSSVETDLIETITERLAEDIFNKAVVNW